MTRTVSESVRDIRRRSAARSRSNSDTLRDTVRDIGVMGIVVPAVGCGGVRDVRVSGLTFISTDGRVLTVAVDSCNAEPSVEVAEQSDRRVVLVARAEGTAGGDCADSGVVVLDAPLGDRALVDRSTGDPIDMSSAQRLDGNNP